jgi:hypothetical protein
MYDLLHMIGRELLFIEYLLSISLSGKNEHEEKNDQNKKKYESIKA